MKKIIYVAAAAVFLSFVSGAQASTIHAKHSSRPIRVSHHHAKHAKKAKNHKSKHHKQ